MDTERPRFERQPGFVDGRPATMFPEVFETVFEGGGVDEEIARFPAWDEGAVGLITTVEERFFPDGNT